jgi:hypothetical protein
MFVETVSVEEPLPVTGTGLGLKEQPGALAPDMAEQERVTVPE